MREVDEAVAWIRAAEFLLEAEDLGRARFTVAAAQAIHSMIKANDALSVEFLGKRSTRHEDAAKLFKEVVRQNKIPDRYARFRGPLGDAVADKSEFDYKGMEVSQEGARRRIRGAREFLAAVEEILR